MQKWSNTRIQLINMVLKKYKQPVAS